MIITKEQCLDLLNEIGESGSAIDLGIELSKLSGEDVEASWDNITEAIIEYTDHDEDRIKDFILEVEQYEFK